MVWFAWGYGVSHDTGFPVKAELPAKPGPLRLCTKYDFMNIHDRGLSHFTQGLAVYHSALRIFLEFISPAKLSLSFLSSVSLNHWYPLAMPLDGTCRDEQVWVRVLPLKSWQSHERDRMCKKTFANKRHHGWMEVVLKRLTSQERKCAFQNKP